MRSAKMQVMPQDSFSNIDGLLKSRGLCNPAKEFLIAQSGTLRFTYSEFVAEVEKRAELLASLGIKKGDRVSLLLANSAEYFVSYFACFKLGAWAGPVNSLLKHQEIEYVISNSEASAVITTPELLPGLRNIQSAAPSVRAMVLIEDGEWKVIAGNSIPAVSRSAEVSLDDEAVIIYTSGTTGKPKGVMLTHRNMLANAKQISEWLGLNENDRALMIMPLFHVNAVMTTGLAALWAGGSIVLEPRFTASRHWQIISEHAVTYFGSVATMLSMLNHTWADGLPAGCDTSSLRFALCGSAPVPVEVIRAFESKFGCVVVEGYGLSESTCRSTFNPTGDGRRPGSVGLPIGNEMRVFDDSDNELGPGKIGEIVLRGPNIMKGYYKNAAATEQAFRSGWFHTGDLGYKDEEGYFYIVDRKSDMIIRAGENIYPREIDEVLYSHPKVKDAATIGVPHEIYGEEVKAFVILREGCEASEEELMDYCKERLADFKCPKTVSFVEDIPKGPTGKLLKRELLRSVS
ncbi:MAG TPA: long-chain fatty acid--CoA ligase [Blastocatellia bacterium]|nr:long-chain fatty acid--CoA ligase [Blastocatellia bacterium]